MSVLDAPDSAEVTWPTRKRDVSMPSRITAVKARSASPRTAPSVTARSIFACSSPRRFPAVRRIQNSIQVTTAAASSIATPSKICSNGSGSDRTVAKMIAPTTTLATIASPAPSQTLPTCAPFPVRTR